MTVSGAKITQDNLSVIFSNPQNRWPSNQSTRLAEWLIRAQLFPSQQLQSTSPNKFPFQCNLLGSTLCQKLCEIKSKRGLWRNWIWSVWKITCGPQPNNCSYNTIPTWSLDSKKNLLFISRHVRESVRPTSLVSTSRREIGPHPVRWTLCSAVRRSSHHCVLRNFISSVGSS